MARLRSNFLSGTITDNPLTNVATTINSGGFASLPTVAAPDTCVLVLDPTGSAGAPEIVIVTTHTAAATSVTVTRGAESTSARQHASNTAWQMNPTALDYTKLNLSSFTEIAQGTTTYTTPAGITAILVECIGAGGGGAGATTSAGTANACGGGGGGGYAQIWIENPAASYACVVGAGGAGGTSSGTNGTDGTSTTFDSPSVCTATGGTGGFAMGTGTVAAITGGGGAGAGTVGSVLLGGGAGGIGMRWSGTVAGRGFGGLAARGGGGGLASSSAGAGSDGKSFGGGGSGALVLNGSAAAAGGNGSNGRIIVWEYGVD